MMRVLVVDDEKIVRVTLSTIMKWEEHGFELIGTAMDGLQALAMMEKNQPDIVITDLKMPNMDGLELIRALHERKYQGQIVVLSNYGDYELVREAMKLGAIDYLLKVTFKPDELLTVLAKAKELITEVQRQKEDHIHLQIELNEKQMQQKNSYWKELLQEDERYVADVWKEAYKFGLTLESLNGHLVYVKLDHYDEALSNGKIKNKKLLDFSVANIIKESISDLCLIDLVEIGEGQYVVIVQERERQYEEAAWLQIIRNLMKSLNLYLNLSISTALSKPFMGYMQLREQYRICRQTASATFYTGTGSMLVAKEMHLQSSLPQAKYSEWSDKFKKAVEEGDSQRVSVELTAIMDEIKSVMYDPNVVKQAVFILLNDIDSMIIKWVKNTGSGEAQTQDHSYILPESVKKKMMQTDTFEEFYQSVEQALHEAVSRLQQAKSRTCRKEVLRVMDIMQENIDAKITLELLAGEVNMNVSYLCRIFKQDVGKSIVQYMNELKVNYALELLKQPDMRVKEVATQVGIEDPFYFNRLFKKMVGCSPTDFRKKLFPDKV